MNKRIQELAEQSGYSKDFLAIGLPNNMAKFAELIVEEFRDVLAEEYRKTPLECCGYFLRADEAIAKHFYGNE